MKKPEKLIVANDAYFGRSVITERSRRLHEKSGKIIEYYVPLERLEEALEVIRFYAGKTKDAEWDGAMFMAFDKFGGIEADYSGPRLAREFLARIEG